MVEVDLAAEEEVFFDCFFDVSEGDLYNYKIAVKILLEANASLAKIAEKVKDGEVTDEGATSGILRKLSFAHKYWKQFRENLVGESDARPFWDKCEMMVPDMARTIVSNFDRADIEKNLTNLTDYENACAVLQLNK